MIREGPRIFSRAFLNGEMYKKYRAKWKTCSKLFAFAQKLKKNGKKRLIGLTFLQRFFNISVVP